MLSDSSRDTDLITLGNAIDATEGHGAPIPCRSGSVTSTAVWTSDDAADQREAAARCEGCPVIRECLTYGMAHPREKGVWGGLTYEQRKVANRRRPRFAA